MLSDFHTFHENFTTAKFVGLVFRKAAPPDTLSTYPAEARPLSKV
jgi:hypothetical protein